MSRPHRSLTEELEEGYAAREREVQAERYARRLERGIDEVFMASVRASLSRLGAISRAGTVDEDMPASVQASTGRMHDSLWRSFAAFIESEVFENKSLERAGRRKTLAMSWSSPRQCWQPGSRYCPSPFGWLRAQILYGLCPADASFWQTVQTPSFWVVLLLTVLPFYGVSVYTYVLLFAIIERTDEYQLVAFICRFKAIQFVVQGFIPALSTSIKRGRGTLERIATTSHAPGPPSAARGRSAASAVPSAATARPPAGTTRASRRAR